jgi:cell wall-associated NlpC family hydrolase
MFAKKTLFLAFSCFGALTLTLSLPAAADEVSTDAATATATGTVSAIAPSAATELAAEASLIERTGDVAATVVDGITKTIGRAIDLVGIRYKRGGLSPETGFDCSGFVSHVFREGVGLVLPHNAKAMSRSGDVVRKDELQPGDLVFFNTMRRAFSHVGIYLGENLFIHAPAPGGEVRVEDMRERYWLARFSGARRISVE